MVVSLAVTLPSSMVDLSTHMVPVVMKKAEIRMLVISDRVSMCSWGFRGGFRSTVGSTGSRPSDCAGGPSMMTLIHRICMGLRGLGTSSRVEREMSIRAAIEVDSWKQTKFLML